MTSNWFSQWIKLKIGDKLYERRPILPFLKSVPDRGVCRNKEAIPKPLLTDKNFAKAGAIQRRRSVSSEYSTKNAFNFDDLPPSPLYPNTVPSGYINVSQQHQYQQQQQQQQQNAHLQRLAMFGRAHQSSRDKGSQSGRSVSSDSAPTLSHSRSSSLSSSSNTPPTMLPKIAKPMTTIVDHDYDYSPRQVQAPTSPVHKQGHSSRTEPYVSPEYQRYPSGSSDRQMNPYYYASG
ncbi:hypothetical protein BGZ94_009457 [Podila epigama]|nr:hypothetical protein BGZ94_009457 [Podila epigama]